MPNKLLACHFSVDRMAGTKRSAAAANDGEDDDDYDSPNRLLDPPIAAAGDDDDYDDDDEDEDAAVEEAEVAVAEENEFQEDKGKHIAGQKHRLYRRQHSVSRLWESSSTRTEHFDSIVHRAARLGLLKQDDASQRDIDSSQHIRQQSAAFQALQMRPTFCYVRVFV